MVGPMNRGVHPIADVRGTRQVRPERSPLASGDFNPGSPREAHDRDRPKNSVGEVGEGLSAANRPRATGGSAAMVFMMMGILRACELPLFRRRFCESRSQSYPARPRLKWASPGSESSELLLNLNKPCRK